MSAESKVAAPVGGVLAVMDADAAHAEAYRIVFGVIDSTPQAMKAESDEARAAVAELIAADKEYDEADAQYNSAEQMYGEDSNKSEMCEARGRIMRAVKRRRAALAPFQTGGAE